MLKSLASNVTAFGSRNFKEVSKVKWGHKGGAIVQYDWFPYKKRKRCVHIKGHMRTPLEHSHLQAKGEVSGEIKPTVTLILDFQSAPG